MKKLISKIISVAMLASSIAGVCGINAMAAGADAHWIEGESGSPTTTAFGQISGAAGTTHDTLSANKAMRIVSGTNTGIGIDYAFEVNTQQSYDIFVHGTYEVNSKYMSQVSMHLDGTQCDVTNLKSEGWIIKGSGDPNYQVGWQKVTANLASGSHTFRWQIDGKGTSAATNKALIDTIIVLPSKADFSPTYMTLDSNAYAVFPMQNRADYELCTLLMSQDLSHVSYDLTLPASTAGDYAVNWSTSDASVITAAGVITQTGSEQTATLTASVTVDGTAYTKDFEVTVAAASGLSGADQHWIESGDYTSIDASDFESVPSFAVRTGLSASNGMRIKNENTNTGIGMDYTFAVNTAQSYDIFVHGTYEKNSEWLSTINMYVDSTSRTITNLGSEGWIMTNSRQIGWQKVTANLTRGSHTFRWQIDGKGSKAEFNNALLDAIVIVPTAAGFVPTPLVSEVFQPQNNADYELCTLLMDEDLSNVTSALTLPASTVDAYDVTWSTSDASVITAAGVPTQSTADTNAVLTASITIDGTAYTKDFAVTVPGTYEDVTATTAISGINDDGVTYRVGLTFGALNPSKYDYIVFQAGTGDGAQQRGGLVSEVIGSVDGDVLIAVILDHSPSSDVAVKFTNDPVTFVE